MDPREAIRRVLAAMGESSLRRVRSKIGSRTLRSALRLIVEESQQRARLFIPHYWAVYYHDGRAGFGPRTASKLVFFDDPRDDPRLAGGYPERASQIRRLTRAQYLHGLDMNRERASRGQRPFMYVVDSVGSARARPFFDELGDGSSRIEGPLAARIFDEWIQEGVDNDPALRQERRDAGFELG